MVGISTDGAAPVFGQAIRAKIEAIIPQGFKAWAEAARQWRPAVAALGLSYHGRRRFWERFTARALEAPNDEPADGLRASLIAQAELEQRGPEHGSIALVGAGPGDPELLTLKAVRMLQAADVVLYDDLVAPLVLDVARREAKKMLVGKTGYRPSCKQDDINALMVGLAKQGKRVVRLKGGDPLIFGRAGEEIAAARTAGIPVEIVPGISSAQGAASRLGVSLTHRDHARRLQFITAHARDGKLPRDLDWGALADPAATTVVYMPQRTWAELAGKAMAAGLGAEVPALAVFSATRPEERRVAATVGTLAEALARAVEEGASGPCLILFGHAIGEAAEYAESSTEPGFQLLVERVFRREHIVQRADRDAGRALLAQIHGKAVQRVRRAVQRHHAGRGRRAERRCATEALHRLLDHRRIAAGKAASSPRASSPRAWRR